MAIFAEGTRFTEAKLKSSQEYAQAKDLPILEHHLLPRPRGLSITLHHFNDKGKMLWLIGPILNWWNAFVPSWTQAGFFKARLGNRGLAKLYFTIFEPVNCPEIIQDFLPSLNIGPFGLEIAWYSEISDRKVLTWSEIILDFGQLVQGVECDLRLEWGCAIGIPRAWQKSKSQFVLWATCTSVLLTWSYFDLAQSSVGNH